jgi:Electron transfer DM13
MAEKNEQPGRGGRPRRRWPLGRLARRHPVISAAAAFIGVGLVIFGLVWFQPQKLFLNKTVNEPVPGVIQTAPAGETSRNPAAGRSPPPGMQALRSGSFRSLEHATTGKAIVLRRPGGSLLLRLERLSTSNGPDLRVYLSHVPASRDLHAYRTGFVDLGALKGNRGSQNYAIPADADLSAFKSAVIWCRRFAVGFGVAPLRPAGPPISGTGLRSLLDRRPVTTLAGNYRPVRALKPSSPARTQPAAMSGSRPRAVVSDGGLRVPGAPPA